MPIRYRTTQRTSPGVRDRLAGQYRVDCIAQIELGGLDARFAEVFHAIIDAAQIENRALTREEHGFRRDGGAGAMGQYLARVEQRGETISVIMCVAPDLFVWNRGIALHGIKKHATRRVRLFDAVHFRGVAVAKGAIRGDEEKHHRVRLLPFIGRVFDAIGVAQGKLHGGICEGSYRQDEWQGRELDR